MIPNCITYQHCQVKAASEHQIRITRIGGRIWCPCPCPVEYRKSIFFASQRHKKVPLLQFTKCWRSKADICQCFLTAFCFLTLRLFSQRPNLLRAVRTTVISAVWCCCSHSWTGALATVQGRSRRQLHLFDAVLHKRFLLWCNFFGEKPFKVRLMYYAWRYSS